MRRAIFLVERNSVGKKKKCRILNKLYSPVEHKQWTSYVKEILPLQSLSSSQQLKVNYLLLAESTSLWLSTMMEKG